MTKRTEAARLAAIADADGIAKAITNFDQQCSKTERTDLCDAWDLLYRIRRDARRIARMLKAKP